jgi:hypothetical protein
MLPAQLESLRERLLRAGVAPRHVQRYLSELRDHYDDALRAELPQQVDVSAARAAAWTRLGTEENLALSVLERPELRCTAARFPALVFGLAPALAWIGAPLALAVVLGLLPEAIRSMLPRSGVIAACYALCFLHTRLLPVLLGAFALELAARRRLRRRWPLAGATVVDVLAGTLTVYTFPGQLGVTSSLLPWLVPYSTVFGPTSLSALSGGLLRAAGMLAFSLVVLQLARHLGIAEKQTPATG